MHTYDMHDVWHITHILSPPVTHGIFTCVTHHTYTETTSDTWHIYMCDTSVHKWHITHTHVWHQWHMTHIHVWHHTYTEPNIYWAHQSCITMVISDAYHWWMRWGMAQKYEWGQKHEWGTSHTYEVTRTHTTSHTLPLSPIHARTGRWTQRQRTRLSLQNPENEGWWK